MPGKANVAALSDLATPWSLRVVATLGVAEQMAGGIEEVGELATKTGSDAESLARVLRHLVGQGVFEEPGEGRFRLNEAARVLLEPGPLRGFDLDGHGGRIAGAWSGLLSAVRTGKPTYETVYGRPFWEDLEANPQLAASYDSLMGYEGAGVPDPDVLLHDDWSSVRRVVDVGGGTGGMLAEILKAHPHVQGTLVDLPRTVERSGEIFEAAGVADRVQVSGQSFFDPLPPGGDVYLLARVLLDWSDEPATQLLRGCAEAAAPNGRVVVVGGVSAGAAASRAGLLLMVLNGGRTRNFTQFTAMAAAAGLKVTASGENARGRFVVEATPQS
ncbi:methyltransferase [Kineosporia babensis]|uniref:O-methyltransferase n=1 Tax=Kineosporia babensis TaxID=499548 RepID=A0A9X1SX17_9ACTN|nr:methyltransferase [Kineosporia babensis]MCD5315717.1 hypothetical protein [Kineosporia babensis]